MTGNDQHLNLLMDVFKFSVDDLAANRSGTLSDSQKLLIPKWASAETRHWLIVWVLIGTPCCLITMSAQSADAHPFFAIFPIMVGLGFIWNTANSLGKWSELAPEVSASILVAIEGVVTKQYVGRLSGQFGCLQLGGIRFYVKPEQYDVVNDYQRYRIYYVTRLKAVVAIEPI